MKQSDNIKVSVSTNRLSHGQAPNDDDMKSFQYVHRWRRGKRGALIVRRLMFLSGLVLLSMVISLSPFPHLSQLESYANTRGAVSADEDALDELFGGVDDAPEEASNHMISDPLSGFNRAMFSLNDKFYFYLLKPVAQGYKKITPQCLRVGINNVFENAYFPLRFVNNILQAKFDRAFIESKVFVINTIAGGLGFATPAQNYFELHTYPEDLGQTLGSYAVGDGFYLVLPILGPSSLRDFVGAAGDTFLSPLTYIESTELAAGLWGVETVNAASFRIGDYEALKDAALDPYVAMRDAYLQMRKKKIDE